jgi:hypothetical protein
MKESTLAKITASVAVAKGMAQRASTPRFNASVATRFT